MKYIRYLGIFISCDRTQLVENQYLILLHKFCYV